MAQNEREVTLKSISLNVKLTAEGTERLSHIRDRIKATSFAQTVRESFRIFDIVTELLSNGETLLVQAKDGKIEKLNFGLNITLKN